MAKVNYFMTKKKYSKSLGFGIHMCKLPNSNSKKVPGQSCWVGLQTPKIPIWLRFNPASLRTKRDLLFWCQRTHDNSRDPLQTLIGHGGTRTAYTIWVLLWLYVQTENCWQLSTFWRLLDCWKIQQVYLLHSGSTGMATFLLHKPIDWCIWWHWPLSAL